MSSEPVARPEPANGKLQFGKKRFGELLIDAGIIDGKDLELALERQRSTSEKLGEVILNMGFATEEQIVDVLAQQLDIRVFMLSEMSAVEPDVVLMLPESMARRHHAVAIARDGDLLTVAMSDPLDLPAIDDIRVATGHQVELRVGRKSDIDEAIATGYRTATVGRHLEEAIEGAKIELGVSNDARLEDIDEDELRSKAEDAPIVRLVSLILGQAVAERATDIHIEPLRDRVVVRYRIDGVLYDTITPPGKFRDAIVVRIKILADMDVAERRIPLDGGFTVRFENRDIDVRVSTLPTIYGEKVAMRLLDKSTFASEITNLGFEPEMLTTFRKALRKPYGMVLISGPTGSGKSTTLYAGLSELDRTTKNITTLEDPVEYHVERISQVHVNRKAGLTFASGLRALLRQDPDIIMIGEVRDSETAELAIRSALTGHLVLSTVHANDAPSTLTRIVDIGIEPYLTASAVHLVMAQRLVRRICPECKEPYEPDPLVLTAFGAEELKGTTFYHGAGCKQCKGRGYRGRIGVYEILEVTPEIAELVTRNASTDVIKRLAIEQGLITLKQGAIKKIREGITTVEEALAIVAESI